MSTRADSNPIFLGEKAGRFPCGTRLPGPNFLPITEQLSGKHGQMPKQN
jgi:hypothetical protein